jgi:hypothetical protein
LIIHEPRPACPSIHDGLFELADDFTHRPVVS